MIQIACETKRARETKSWLMKRIVYIILPLLSKGVLPGAWHHGLVVTKLFLVFFFSHRGSRYYPITVSLRLV